MDDDSALRASDADRQTDDLERGEIPDERRRSKSRSPGARDYKRRYGRSRSPADRGSGMSNSRRHSRSPSRDRTAPRKSKGGFNWKEKASSTDSDARVSRLERRYREQDGRERDRFRYRSREHNQELDKDRRGDRDDRRSSHRREGEDNHRDRIRDRDRTRNSRDARDERRDFKEGRQRVKNDPGTEPDMAKEGKKEKGEKMVVTSSAQTMIVVYINDRLGTKAGIPCLPSDPIKLFKAQVAARIGREPHEIMLKRQGERPFKDQLTLEDYGVSNGVQLDLELDTGD